jgi:hypothetical protein
MRAWRDVLHLSPCCRSGPPPCRGPVPHAQAELHVPPLAEHRSASPCSAATPRASHSCHGSTHTATTCRHGSTAPPGLEAPLWIWRRRHAPLRLLCFGSRWCRCRRPCPAQIQRGSRGTVHGRTDLGPPWPPLPPARRPNPTRRDHCRRGRRGVTAPLLHRSAPRGQASRSGPPASQPRGE